jgi:ABC-type sugar transport system permease subunit
MLFLVIGGMAKYTALLLLVHFILGIEGFDPGTARLVTVVMILIIIGLSFISSYIYKKRLKKGKKEGL